MTIFAPSNTQRGNGFAAARAATDERYLESLRRQSDPTEQHVRFIRSRGFSIYRSSVVGGPDDRWRYCGRDITADELAAEADRIRGRMTGPAADAAKRGGAADAATRGGAVSALTPAPAAEPESQKARKPESQKS